uniref:NADH dehydrogenase subunit 5 n=1 Tax=Cheiloneurus chinensis TaxID=3082044 RepID=UPI002A825F03|nr:NADH dehydrogenase subunit 5 [Cheiloneurus chinensis]WOE90956.1 NADH dehydrogenase subunit 5 [Cheiloneurus chinensis]
MYMYYFTGIFSLIISVFILFMGMIFMSTDMNLFMEWSLIFMNSLSIDMLIYLDWIALIFIFTVLLIFSMIMFYCCEYMCHELNKMRFFYLVLIFVLSMIFMVISPNLISIILGWDGLGLSSYCLVIFYQNSFSFNSGMLTVLMNRVGDIMIIMSISILMISGSFNIFVSSLNRLDLIFLVVIASFTKSAQFPFSSWLPAAMAAPTPVSSLVHSSTLVTAGIYLLIRFYNLIYLNLSVLLFLLSIGMITMFMAGVSANFEFDFKKIIAYSTLSQLGLMLVVYSMKFFFLSYFHLIIHAMFKSMMFMCSGVIIHFMLGYQDIRFMGNLMDFFPLTMMMMMISNFSLCGLPFFSGFYSKDLILEKIFLSNFSLIMFFLLLVSTMLTVIYSFRLLMYLISKNFYFLSFYKMNDFKVMNISMFILLINSMFLGKVFIYIMFMGVEDIYLLLFEKLLILMLCLFSLVLSKMYYLNKFSNNNLMKFILGKMFILNYVNKFYNMLLIKMKIYNNILDKGFMNYIFESYLNEFLLIFNFKVLNNIYLMNFMMMMSYMLMFMILI